MRSPHDRQTCSPQNSCVVAAIESRVVATQERAHVREAEVAGLGLLEDAEVRQGAEQAEQRWRMRVGGRSELVVALRTVGDEVRDPQPHRNGEHGRIGKNPKISCWSIGMRMSASDSAMRQA